MDLINFLENGMGGANSFAQTALRLGPLVYLGINLMSSGLRSFTDTDRQLDSMDMASAQNQIDTFDFIIVGGGSSGSSLASRLSQKFSVLLLESGGTPSPLHLLPTLAFSQFNDPTVDWGYETVPQKQACFGLNNNTSIWPGGKVLGGSSLLNAMIYLRGNVQGFDEIAEKTGDSKWKLKNILKYYKSLEDYNGWFDSGLHGKGGPLSIEKPFVAKYADNFMRAGEELGYSLRDPNPDGPNTEGFAKMDSYMKNGRRSDAYHEFLLPEIRKGNKKLVIRKYSHVRRLLFREGSGENEVEGVEYHRHGGGFMAKARFEVILSAGAIRTPQILMLSGIGPKEELRRHGIPVRMSLPVGQYLQDKYGALVGPFLIKSGTGFIYERDISLRTVIQWATTGQGRLTSALADGTYSIFKNPHNISTHLKKPNIHTYILSITMPPEISAVLQRAYNFKPEVLEHFQKASKTDSFFQLVTINTQQGKGTLSLRDGDPISYPVIDPKYLENEEDAKTLLEGVKLSVKLVEDTEAMGEINGKLMEGHLPGCENYKFKSDEYYECYLRHVTITAFKFSGTAPIGKGLSDPDAVVNSHLKVLGIKKLRVVDASVLQQRHVSINDVTCRMLGQFAADIILDEWT